MSTKNMGFRRLLVILGVLGTSLSAALIRWSTAPSLVLVVYRTGLAALLLTPLAIAHRREFLQLGRRDLLLCLLSGVFLGLHFSAYFESVRRTSIAASVVLVNVEVLFVALASVALFRRRLGRRTWLAVLLAFGGSVVVALAGSGEGTSLLGNLLALLGAFFMSVYTMLGSVCRRRASTTVYTYLVYWSAAGTVAALSLAGGLSLAGWGTRNLLLALGMAVFCTLMGHSVFSWALKYLPPAFISTAKLLDPLFSAGWGLLFFDERPGPPVLLGGAVILLGVLLYSREDVPAPDTEPGAPGAARAPADHT